MSALRPSLLGLTRLLGRIEAIAASILLVAMVAIVFLDVMLRYIWNAPIRGAGELATTLFVWVVMLGAASAARRRLHVGIDWFVEQLPSGAQAWVRVAATACVTVTLLVTAWFGVELMNGSRDRTLPLTGIPLRNLYAGLPLGCVLMAIAYLAPPVPRDDIVIEEPIG